MVDTAARHAAMAEFLGTFPTLSGTPPETLADLSDGVALFEVLSEIAPEYFDPTTIARHLGDNWALKSSNLRKLLRNLEYYYHEELHKDADFMEVTQTVGNIARSGDADAIANMVELVAAAAVTCESKGEFVGRIMGMSPEGQIQMKGIIESSLSRLSDYDMDHTEGDEEEEGDNDNEMVFGEESGIPASGDTSIEGAALFDANHLKESNGDADALEQALIDAKRELAQMKNQSTELRDDNERTQAKLRALVEDLQDRLAQRQDQLIAAEEELRTLTNDLDDAKTKVSDLEEKNATLADELDVASAKAAQLHKAEATVMAYKKKLETVGVMNQQMTDLEDQAAGYLSQIMDLEAEVKKTATVQKQADALQRKLEELEKGHAGKEESVKAFTEEIAELKSRLNAAESAKKLFEDELQELRAQQSAAEPVDIAVEGFDGMQQNSAASREKSMRLEIENKKLKAEIESLKNGGASPAAAAAAAASVPSSASGGEELSSDAKTLQEEVCQLKEELAKKEAENRKIGNDKNKLEAYTKRTLAKFQDKYLVALQECKAKLKEKQDKIEVLEARSASEKTAQKREERLLSSTIYELGMAIMQNRLKER